VRRSIDSGALILWCGIIYLLSDRPTLPMPMLFPMQDKVNHFIAYAVMGVLAFRAVRHRFGGNTLWIASLLFCSLYGVSDEYHQSFVPGRMSEVADWLADTLGAAAAIGWLFKSKNRDERINSGIV